MNFWRVGTKVRLNVYEGDRPICQCHTEEDAARVVRAVNRMIANEGKQQPKKGSRGKVVD